MVKLIILSYNLMLSIMTFQIQGETSILVTCNACQGHSGTPRSLNVILLLKLINLCTHYKKAQCDYSDLKLIFHNLTEKLTLVFYVILMLLYLLFVPK